MHGLAVAVDEGVYLEISAQCVPPTQPLWTLQEENTRLKQLVAELSLDKTMLQDVLRKKF